jgi:hypothetical protein
MFFHAFILGWKRKIVNINIWLFMWIILSHNAKITGLSGAFSGWH